MHNAGVLVAYNSDDAECLEDWIKKLKSEQIRIEEASWKFVNVNSAKLFHIDDKVGSGQAGKRVYLVLLNTVIDLPYRKTLKELEHLIL
jgi:N-acetylglucosamine-6-phosphate deacetylase